MDWMEVLTGTLDYVEAHLLDSLTPQEIAESQYVSGFYFQKAFKILTGYTIGEYIRCRRLYLAALELLKGNDKIIDLALKYGYETPESFSRAFSHFHGASPIQIRQKKHEIKTFLPLSVSLSVKGGARLDYVVEPEEAFEVIGIKKKFTFEEAYTKIPEFWREADICHLPEKLENALKGCDFGSFGVSFGQREDQTRFSYMIAGRYRGGEAPEGFSVEKIPALTWAKFFCSGPLPGGLQTVNSRIFREWAPGHPEYEIAECINVERYSGKDIASMQFKSEIWIPVRKNQRTVAEGSRRFSCQKRQD